MISKKQANAVASALTYGLRKECQRRDPRLIWYPELDRIPLGRRTAAVKEAKRRAWRSLKNCLPTAFASVIVMLPVSVPAQRAGENSVPEPTRLSEIAAAPGARTEVIGAVSRIESEDAVAEIAAVEVTAPTGEQEFGVRIALEDDRRSDSILLDAEQTVQFRRDIRPFDFDNYPFRSCEPTAICVAGIARCRPGGTPQAYCPGIYQRGDDEAGAQLSTARNAFRFPSVRGAQFANAVEAVMDQYAAAEAD